MNMEEVCSTGSTYCFCIHSIYSDEISALVLDPGYSTTRAGFAGEDVPKSIVPSYYGLIPSDSTPKHAKHLFGDNSINIPFPRISISNVMSKEGTVEDWNTAANLWEYAITSRLTNTKPTPLASNGLNDPNEDVAMEGVEEQEKPLAENPLLMTETGWNAGKDREKGIEIAMENWGCPAFWLARNGVLAAFVSRLSCPDTSAYRLQLRLRKTHSPRRRYGCLQHLHHTSPRRPHLEKGCLSLPFGWKFCLQSAAPALRLFTTTHSHNATLSDKLQNSCRRWCPSTSYISHFCSGNRTTSLISAFSRRARAHRVQRERRECLDGSGKTWWAFTVRGYELGRGQTTSWQAVRDA